MNTRRIAGSKETKYRQNNQPPRDPNYSKKKKPKPQVQAHPKQKDFTDVTILSNEMMILLGKSVNAIGGFTSTVFLIGLVISASFLDIVFGTLALANTFTLDIPFAGYIVSRETIAIAISMFTSGSQVALMLYWRSKKRKLTAANWLLMGAIVLMDTAIDMTTPGYLMYGETALTMTLQGKPPMYFVVVIMAGLACAFSENVVVALAALGKKE